MDEQKQIPDIREIRVYDPKVHGLDFQTYLKACLGAGTINLAAAQSILEGLSDRVECSEVAPGLSLREYLRGEHGYFARNPNVFGVLFFNGRFDSEYDGELWEGVNFARISQEENAIVFPFSDRPQAESLEKIERTGAGISLEEAAKAQRDNTIYRPHPSGSGRR